VETVKNRDYAMSDHDLHARLISTEQPIESHRSVPLHATNIAKTGASLADLLPRLRTTLPLRLCGPLIHHGPALVLEVARLLLRAGLMGAGPIILGLQQNVSFVTS
jgi:hypothetical protein